MQTNGNPKVQGSEYDVIVMGAGPAGCCVSTLLARKGRRVLMLEKEFYPRHHIGESLIPETYWVLEKMGLLEKMKSSHFTKKFSVQFYTPDARASKPFYFFETNHHESAVTWQVDRSEFDTMLLAHAREQGVEAHEGAAVKDVIFEGERAVGVEVQFSSREGTVTETRRFNAKVIVDATGQGAVIGSKLGIRLRDPKLRKGVVYGYFKNAMRDPGIDGGATLVLRMKKGNGWFWFIPLADDITSIGAVADADYLLKNRGKDYEKILMEEIEACEAVKTRVANATRVHDIHTIGDYSYRSTQCAGPGWVLVGDAYAFLDPIYSTGVFLALKGGEMVSEAVEDALVHEDYSEERLGAWGARLTQGIETFRKFVYTYYTEGFSFGNFGRQYPQFRANIIDILVGNVLRPGIDDIFVPLAEYCDIPAPVAEAAIEKPPLQGAKS